MALGLHQMATRSITPCRAPSCWATANARPGASGSCGTPELSRRWALQLAGAAWLPLQLCAPGGVGGAGRAAAAQLLPPYAPEVQAAIEASLSKVVTKGKAPVSLRLPFHDAGTFNAAAGNGGLNASIRFELDRPESFNLKRGWRAAESVHNLLKGTAAEGLVSYSDAIVLAGARAVAVTGGPVIPVALGRKDADGPDPENRMPSENASAEESKAAFAAMGLSTQEMVALCGAHTLGNKGFGDPATFDNTYFVSLLSKPWLDKTNDMASMIGLPSDHAIAGDEECLRWIQLYADDQSRFFDDFSVAYIKMTSLGVTWV